MNSVSRWTTPPQMVRRTRSLMRGFRHRVPHTCFGGSWPTWGPLLLPIANSSDASSWSLQYNHHQILPSTCQPKIRLTLLGCSFDLFSWPCFKHSLISFWVAPTCQLCAASCFVPWSAFVYGLVSSNFKVTSIYSGCSRISSLHKSKTRISKLTRNGAIVTYQKLHLSPF